jgi:DNA-binding HxlR family transcriptional regulator
MAIEVNQTSIETSIKKRKANYPTSSANSVNNRNGRTTQVDQQLLDSKTVNKFPVPDHVDTMVHQRSTCPVESTLSAIGGRWKVLILKELFDGVKRFGQLHRALHGITQKMLTQQLREMERDGLVNRQVYRQVPPKVEYSLTIMGETLQPVLESMHKWGIEYIEHQQVLEQDCQDAEDEEE